MKIGVMMMSRKGIDYKEYTKLLLEWLKSFQQTLKCRPNLIAGGKAPALFVRNQKFVWIRDYVCHFVNCPGGYDSFWERHLDFEEKLIPILNFDGKFEDIEYKLECGHKNKAHGGFFQCQCGKWYYNMLPAKIHEIQHHLSYIKNCKKEFHDYRDYCPALKRLNNLGVN